MNNKFIKNENSLTVAYQFEIDNDRYSMEVNADKECLPIKKDSETDFITELYWGYAKVNNNKTNEYEVTHPRWVHYKLTSYSINVDFNKVYGKEFSFLNNLSPHSVILAKGSNITVEKRKKICF